MIIKFDNINFLLNLKQLKNKFKLKVKLNKYKFLYKKNKFI